MSDSSESSVRIGLHSPPEFLAFLRPFADLFYRSEGRWAMNRYVLGLLALIKRKNCERIAAAVVGTSGDKLQALLTDIPWDYSQMDHLRVDLLLKQATVGDGALIFDDTGIPKQGHDSVGVARQYSGTLGKVGNCQISVTCRYADPGYTWPVAGRLYLPRAWTDDDKRRAKAKVPKEVKFQTKAEIALALLDQAKGWGIPHEAVTADCNYGDNPNFLAGLEARNEPYVVAVPRDFTVRLPAELAKASQEADQADPTGPGATNVSVSEGEPAPDIAAGNQVRTAEGGSKAKPKRRGRPPNPPRVLSPEERAPLHKACELTRTQPESVWQAITYREGAKGPIIKEFLALRACRALKGNAAGEGAYTSSEGWLIGERPLVGHDGEPKWYYSNFPAEAALSRMAEVGHRREPIERGYRVGKDGLGLDDAEVRLWHGFHRHQALVMLAETWLVLQRQWPEPIAVPPPVPDSALAMPTSQAAEAALPPGEAAPTTPVPTPPRSTFRPMPSPPYGVDRRNPPSRASEDERMVLHQPRPLAGRHQADRSPACSAA
jgi:SRSO17 transposase